MPILSLSKVSLAYGHHPLLSDIDLTIDPGDRMCVVGRNGAGKSSLFRVVAGNTQPDSGDIWRKDTLRISYLEQEVLADTGKTAYQLVASGLGQIGEWLNEYYQISLAKGASDVSQLNQLQRNIESADGWNYQRKVESVISQLGLPTYTPISECSGGIRRRLMLARALVSEPDLLLLDEPTNHMDIAAISWLEGFLQSYTGALLFITHDRTLLKTLAQNILELDRGTLTRFNGGYSYYLQKKQELLETEARANKNFDKRLARHEAWIRQGIKARRTRNEGRVRTLQSMRQQRAQRIESKGKVNLNLVSGQLSGKLVTELQHVCFGYDDQWIVEDFSTQILRGDRIGIIGPNGSGKSTLLGLILGDVEPTSGEVNLGTKLEIAYFDQQRNQLDARQTVRQNIGQGQDYIRIKGRSRHIVSYLKDFLFPIERIDAPVEVLSGGERNRLLLAKLFTLPANLLVMDEPTNDLDVDTLELLEELLSDFDGTLLLVSHDRTFLDNVVTSTMVFEGDARVREYVGGYDDWIRQRESPSSAPAKPREKTPARPGAKPKQQKISYKEKRELDSLPARIEELEAQQQELQQSVNTSAFYRQDKDTISKTLNQLDQMTAVLEQTYERWEYLAKL